jgi:hypothetical protein
LVWWFQKKQLLFVLCAQRAVSLEFVLAPDELYSFLTARAQ